MFPNAISGQLKGVLLVGWWWQVILIARVMVTDLASHASEPWSGYGKHCEGKLSPNIHPPLC